MAFKTCLAFGRKANHVFQIQASRTVSRAAVPALTPLPSHGSRGVRGSVRRISQAVLEPRLARQPGQNVSVSVPWRVSPGEN